MLVTNISEINYIFLFQSYNLLDSLSKYKLVCRIRFVIPKNAELELDNNLIMSK